VETLVGRHIEPPAAVNLETVEQLAVRGFVLLIGEHTRIMKCSNIVQLLQGRLPFRRGDAPGADYRCWQQAQQYQQAGPA
jgi:hypothetical protein